MSVSFPRPLDVKALPDYHLFLSYDDKTEGDVDLSDLVNQGVFKAWNTDVRFDEVYIDKVSDAIAWNTMLEICPDSLYLKIKGLSFEEWASTHKQELMENWKRLEQKEELKTIEPLQ